MALYGIGENKSLRGIYTKDEIENLLQVPAVRIGSLGEEGAYLTQGVELLEYLIA